MGARASSGTGPSPRPGTPPSLTGMCEGAALGAATSESAGGGARPTALGATDVVPAAGRSRRLPAPSPGATGCLSPTGPSPWGRQAFGPEGPEAMAREGGRGGATTARRVARHLAVLRGTRDGVMPSGEARIDERTRPLAAKDRVGGVAGMGAYPGDRICIAVGCDDAGRSLVARAGPGRPGKSRCWDAYGGHIERGPGPAHDMESVHSILVDRLGPGGVAYRSADPGGLDDAHDPLRRADHTHFPLRESVRRHSGLGRDRIDDWPDLLSVIVNPPSNRLERVAMAPGRAMSLPISLPYRGYHERDSSSE